MCGSFGTREHMASNPLNTEASLAQISKYQETCIAVSYKATWVYVICMNHQYMIPPSPEM